MRVALSIASVAPEVGEIDRRTEHVRLDLRHHHGEAAGRTNEAERASVLDEAIQDPPASWIASSKTDALSASFVLPAASPWWCLRSSRTCSVLLSISPTSGATLAMLNATRIPDRLLSLLVSRLNF